MPNVIWYIILAVISLFFLIFTLIKIKDKRVIVLYTFLSGLTYLVEYVVLVIFKSYVYDPDIMKNPYFDSVLGSVISNALTVPIAGTLVGTFKLGLMWRLFIIGIFFIIESGLLYLKIYFHFWRRDLYTAVSLFILFIIAKKWYEILSTKMTSGVRFISLFFTSTLIQASSVFFLVAIFHVYLYRIGWFQAPVRDHIAFATSYILLFSLLFSLMTTYHIKWLWRILAVILTLPIDWFLWKQDILNVSHHWSLVSFLFFRLSVLILVEMFNRYFLDENIKD